MTRPQTVMRKKEHEPGEMRGAGREGLTGREGGDDEDGWSEAGAHEALGHSCIGRWCIVGRRFTSGHCVRWRVNLGQLQLR